MSKCYKCGEMLMPWWTYCPTCGEQIKQENPTEVIITCPRCQGTGKIKVSSLWDIPETDQIKALNNKEQQ